MVDSDILSLNSAPSKEAERPKGLLGTQRYVTIGSGAMPLSLGNRFQEFQEAQRENAKTCEISGNGFRAISSVFHQFRVSRRQKNNSGSQNELQVDSAPLKQDSEGQFNDYDPRKA
ncbi:hypothetical protein AMTR_s00120p00064540 [Amborella trichopoda]|uniref:Uncharacterized protein n=1 Tax=Amborella trichopoda TaxID=13333 RepID=W1NR82_AMBTC|nr:hypothetical protein AMTR_s00120p00064540 [Amborella trichopoda]